MVVSFQLVLRSIASQKRFAGLIESEPVWKRMRFGPAIPYTSAPYVRIEAHDLFPRLWLGVPGREVRGRKPALSEVQGIVRLTHYFTPFGYTNILLASPVFSRSIALEKSFIEIRSVMTGCKSNLPALRSAVI